MNPADYPLSACERCVYSVQNGQVLPEVVDLGAPESLCRVSGPRDDRPGRVRLAAFNRTSDRCDLCGLANPVMPQGARLRGAL